MTSGWRFCKIACLLITTYLIAGCALKTLGKDKFNEKETTFTTEQAVPSYQGRLSLRVASDPPQAIYANFHLSGDANKGDLALNSPLGNVLAKLSWTPDNAVLQTNNDKKEYPSTMALIEHVTGTTLPLKALFDWMAGKETPAEGWEIDLSAMPASASNHTNTSRFVAKRLSPLPTAELRVAIDQ